VLNKQPADAFAAAPQILDVAAASGEPALSLALALPEARLISTDLGDSFAGLGRARAAQAGVGGRVEFQTADAEDLRQFGDGSMDAVTCSLGKLFTGIPG
jgi:ubiquinone/menaquinone biosynthesis C-methylase UbiE